MKTFVLAIGLSVAAVGSAQADCSGTLANRSSSDHQYAFGRNENGAFVALIRGNLLPGESVEFTMLTADGGLGFRLLDIGATDLDDYNIGAYFSEAKMADCAWDLFDNAGVCFDKPAPGDITLMDPLRNCGLT